MKNQTKGIICAVVGFSLMGILSLLSPDINWYDGSIFDIGGVILMIIGIIFYFFFMEKNDAINKQDEVKK